VESELSVSTTIDSKVESVDAAEEFVRSFANDAGFEESDRYYIGLAAREILINAVMHGNRFDGSKKVGIRLSKNADSLTIEVTDEGDGFRLEDVPDPRVGENRKRRSGRGLTMAVAIMDELLVEKNRPRGTHIRMVKRLAPR
jgi:serine/threonine-protein kinase RsbW